MLTYRSLWLSRKVNRDALRKLPVCEQSAYDPDMTDNTILVVDKRF